MDTFMTFWEGELDNGSALFKLQLRYPETSTLTEYGVKVMSELQWGMVGPNYYSVALTIQIVSGLTLSARAARWTGDTVSLNFKDAFTDYTTSAQDVAPFPTDLNGGILWDKDAWEVTLGA
jgi:hypothetical protein